MTAGAGIGFFDGLHRGHMYLLNSLKGKAGTVYAVSFDKPIKKLSLPLLLTYEEKVELISAKGFEPFMYRADEVRHLSPEEFFLRLLEDIKDLRVIAVGEDFRFGRGAQGDVRVLRELSERYGVEVLVLPKLRVNGTVVSSSLIRKLISEGRVREANELLGYRFFLSGEVVHGQAIGKTLGFPTSNLRVPPMKLIPKQGVYLARALPYASLPKEGKEWYLALCHIGPRPTFDDSTPRVEVWMDGFEGSLYGARLTVELVDYIRPVIRFSSPRELRAQIMRDIELAREMMSELRVTG